jgi:hypothetical protein
MRKSLFTEEQIIAVLKAAEASPAARIVTNVAHDEPGRAMA